MVCGDEFAKACTWYGYRSVLGLLLYQDTRHVHEWSILPKIDPRLTSDDRLSIKFAVIEATSRGVAMATLHF
eukprot:scaffold17477_cov41-Cyclotella_meneghiniana.AAC.3